MIDLYQGDCLDQMDKVADHAVDMIFTDLPYGTTKNAWDGTLSALGRIRDISRRRGSGLRMP